MRTAAGFRRGPLAGATPIDFGIASPDITTVLGTVVIGVAVACATIVFLKRPIWRAAAILENTSTSVSMAYAPCKR